MEHPGLAELITFLRSNPPKSPAPADMRAWFAAILQSTPVPSEARLERSTCDVPAYFITPPGADTSRVIFYLHGGAYILGSSETHLETVFRLAKCAGVRALSVDYRLAPEHAWPACREDAVAAYRWLLAQDVAPSRIALAGDSAGGGLTLSTLLALRDAGLPMPGCAAFFSPWVDFTASGDSTKTNAEIDPLVDPRGLAMMAGAVLQGNDPAKSSPLFADLHGLPPLFVQVGTAEVLLDDSRRLVDKVKAAGGEAVLDVWEHMIHGFQAFPTYLPEAISSTERAADFLRARLSRA
ncbi:alpha/beta hydrolase [Polyangium jinanense]|uniref:Alpha/beta hydrolase n=1 Tax=Polyangium jinanense TaxID=2829994 RepID=A0A9X4AVV6_9BACT|nr:alpha/beta hydrolase [Polyangium jinanense]MDC3957195.1 alpha/beta hydrolase [Polyangium jinanense]MDC3986648.1 alpha/beta hydrolase [Polyangium jinanense]